MKMIKRTMVASVATLVLATAVSGCSILYPNWNTTSKPGDPSTPSASTSTPSSESPSATPTPTPTVALKKAQIAWVDSGVDSSVIYAVAEITNVVEDGGTCTLTFIGAGKTKTVSGKAEVNATDTQCHPLEIPLAGLPKGAGLITMSYSSPTHAGTSAAVAVNIP